MVEKEEKDHILLGGGPLGLGDPDDRRLRKAERDLVIPKLLREEARKKCTETFQFFYECSKSAGLAVTFKCKDEKKIYEDCLLSWCNNSDFVNEITNKYLEDRKHYRLTGEPVKKYDRKKS